jgi:hypothetical protein
VHVYQAGGGEFGLVLGEEGGEGALVVIIAVDGGVVDTADIDDGVAFFQLGGIAGAHEWGGGVGGQETEQVDGQSFVGVEVAARKGSKLAFYIALKRGMCKGNGKGKLLLVSPDQGGGGLELLCNSFGHFKVLTSTKHALNWGLMSSIEKAAESRAEPRLL